MGELYGEVNLDTQEWTDGLASKYIRESAMETEEDKTWVVFDGPVDALWIENMNTVLDDNMTLCLANGQRIKLRVQMRMLFEVQDLAVASPATVSRCGMVYFDVMTLGWRPYVETWLQTFFEDLIDDDVVSPMIIDHLRMLFLSTVDPALEFIRQQCNDEPIKTTDLQLVVSLCNLLEHFFDEKKGFKGPEEEKKKIAEAVFAWCYAWGLGASLTATNKARFDSVIREQFKSSGIPPTNTVFDFHYDMKPKDKVYKPWALPEFAYDKDKSFFDLFVPTEDTIKHSVVLQTLFDMGKPCFFTGESGVGKTVIIQALLDTLKEGDLQPININMSAQTTSLRTQQSIEDKLEQKRRGVLGAQPGKRVAVFIDDINMPAKEFYGAQPPIELLRLFIDRKGMYDRAAWEWRAVEDTTVIACAAPPSGGRADLSMRFTRVFNMVNLPQPSEGTLGTIFKSILEGFLATGFGDKVKACAGGAIDGIIEVYYRI
jgi:dynein heavy chain